jgi:hypothetical protein
MCSFPNAGDAACASQSRMLVLSLSSLLLVGTASIAGAQERNVVLRWNEDALQAAQDTRSFPTVAARALAIVHTSMYDAWAAYDSNAEATHSPTSRMRARTSNDISTSVSYAAYRSLKDLFPSEAALFDNEIESLGLDPNITSGDPSNPAEVGMRTNKTIWLWVTRKWLNVIFAR